MRALSEGELSEASKRGQVRGEQKRLLVEVVIEPNRRKKDGTSKAHGATDCPCCKKLLVDLQKSFT